MKSLGAAVMFHVALDLVKFLGIAASMAVHLIPSPSLAESCDARWEALRTWDGDVRAFQLQVQRLLDDRACTVAFKRRVERAAAVQHIGLAKRQVGGPEGFLDVLMSGMRFGRPWPLMAAIGDALQAGPEKNFTRASQAYQEALSDIAGPPIPNDFPVSDQELQTVRRLAYQTRLLANNFVRSADPIVPPSRGLKVEIAPLPIQFEYDTDHMTSIGARYADEVALALAGESRPKIKVIGHTDRRGSDAYNLRLSAMRAQAVKKYLVARGYDQNAIRSEGRGFHDPLKIEREELYSQDEIYQMNRRVEITLD